MALIADDAADRVAQLTLLTERLGELIDRETAQIEAHAPALSGPAGEEKARLANAYRQEMTRIAENGELIRGAPAPALAKLRAATGLFRQRLSRHERALAAVKEVSEGLVRAIAEEVARARAGARGYGANGSYAAQPASAAAALALNKTA